MTQLQTLGRALLIPVALAGVFALDLAMPFDAHAQSTTQGRSPSNPDGGGVDKPFAADGQAAFSQDDGHDGNNGPGNDPTPCDDSNGPKRGCENTQIPFAPALAYPALGALTFATAYGVRRLRRQA